MTPEFLAEQNKELVKMSLCEGPSCREVHPPEDNKEEDNMIDEHSSNVAAKTVNNQISNNLIDDRIFVL